MSLLQDLFPDQDITLEKTAAQRVVDYLHSDEPDKSDLRSIPTAELQKLANQMEQSMRAQGLAPEDEARGEEALAQLRGQVAAHAFAQEAELIKVAASQGVCRVCHGEAVDRSLHPTIGPNCLPQD